MVAVLIGYAGYTLLCVFQFFLNIWQYLQQKADDVRTNIKKSMFEDMVVSYGFYDKEHKCYMTLYDFDHLWTLVWLYIKYNVFKRRTLFVPIFDTTPKDLASERFVFVGSFVKEGNQYYTILDADSASRYDYHDDTPSNNRFVYCIADDKCDLTHMFEKYHYSLSLNKTILCEDIISIMLFLSNKSEWMRDAKLEQLKLMYENDLNEIVFKGEDRLDINPQS